MKCMASYLLFVLAAACGSGEHENPAPPDSAVPDAPDAPPDAAPDAPDPPKGPPPETQALDMNDISMVVPARFAGLFGKLSDPQFSGDLVPRALYVRLATSHHDITNDFGDFVIFAIRFDLCDRVVPGPCPEGADGSLRLVFQPLLPFGNAADVGLHAFYPIPAADLASVINELRAIARLSRTPLLRSGPLGGSDGKSFAGVPRLKALVNKYAIADHLIRLTMMGQDTRSAEPRVVFRGLELHDGQMVDMTVATTGATEQDAALTGADPSYTLTPVSDVPAGFALALSADSFNAATAADQRSALDALVATENPRLHTAATLQCSACHVSTYLGVHRADFAGIDVRTLPSFFTTARDVRVSQGISEADEHSLHAFGWLGPNLAISQRVANETAMVLDEIDRRFPVPTP